MATQDLVREGKLDEAMASAKADVKAKPADPKLRVMLFQLFVIAGDWDRALTQLNVAADLDETTKLMATVCRPMLQIEGLRRAVFSGERSPLIFGQPDHWMGLLVQANALLASGKGPAAAEMRDKAFELAPATSGVIDGTPFEWFADSDQRLGPMLEAVIDAKYYWVPFTRIRSIMIEEPTDLRDLAWLPAQITWANGGSGMAMLLARYPGSEMMGNPQLRMARRTEWIEHEGGVLTGLGQRMFATDQDEYPILQARSIQFNVAEQSEAPGGQGG
ncbi:MAG: virulence protein SciE type [Phycisphaeraceae bacterium]|nr:virulence protein SciE type [Phycisphaeraceae bacterium]